MSDYTIEYCTQCVRLLYDNEMQMQNTVDCVSFTMNWAVLPKPSLSNVFVSANGN